MQSEISHPRNFAQLERWFACSRPLLEAKRCGIRVENKTVHTMAKHILKREQGASPSIVGEEWRESPKHGLYCDAGNRAVLDGSRVPKILVEVAKEKRNSQK